MPLQQDQSQPRQVKPVDSRAETVLGALDDPGLVVWQAAAELLQLLFQRRQCRHTLIVFF
jgi:hypothetical protein